MMEGVRERRGRREERPGREEKEEGEGRCGVIGHLQGDSSVAWAASRRWHRAALGQATQQLSVSQRRRQRADFAKGPLGKGDIWGGFQAVNICNYLLIETCSMTLRN
jgi:hypothetical protein